MRLLLALGLSLVVTSCASSKEGVRDEPPPAASAQLPSSEQKPEAGKPVTGPGMPATTASAGGGAVPAPAQPAPHAGPGPMTASEAADHLSRELRGAGGDAGTPGAAAPAGHAAHGGKSGGHPDGGSGAHPDGGSSASSTAAARPQPAAEGADAFACETDADCGFTRVAAGACCPMLCEPRVVAKKHAQALSKAESTCTPGGQCPQPMCRPPRQQQAAACVEHKCTAKVSRTAIEN